MNLQKSKDMRKQINEVYRKINEIFSEIDTISVPSEFLL